MYDLRKRIRRVLDDTGCTNCFDLSEINIAGECEAPAKLLVIKEWTPDGNAVLVRKTIERCTHEKVIVDFSIKNA